MTTTTNTRPKCGQCRKRATHYRRYEKTEGSQVAEFYVPVCEAHGDAHWRAPRIPLAEVA